MLRRRPRSQHQLRTVKRATHLNGVSREGEPRRRRKREAVMAATYSGWREVCAVTVGKNLPDQPTVGIDVETYRRFGVVNVLRPTFYQVVVTRSI